MPPNKNSGAPGLRSIRGWTAKKSRFSSKPVFMHGNMHLENILVSSGSIFLLDFENCGTGNPCDDVALVTSRLVFMSAFPLFPWH